MKKPVLILCLFLQAAAFVRPGHGAEQLFVTDELEITVRRGASLEHKITKMIQSGTPVEKLEEQDGWARIRTPDGHEGWVIARYLTDSPPKGPRLAAAEQELQALRAQAAECSERLKAATAEASQSAREAAGLKEKLGAVESEFTRWKEANRDVLSLRERAEALEAEGVSAREELERLRLENRTLQAREKFYWFFSGVIVLLSGWILGYLYASSRHRGRSQGKFRY